MRSASPTVLVVDDAPELREIVRRLLGREGFRVVEAADAEVAAVRVREDRPDLILVDIELGGVDGIELCGTLRDVTDAYIVMLTGRGAEADKVMALTVGADDYLTKPFGGAELVARVRAMLRRPRGVGGQETARPAPRRIGPLELDAGAREALVDGAPVALTRKEFDLLMALADSPNVVLTRGQLLDAVWGPSWFGDDHVVDVHMSNMRRKLQAALGGASPVRTVRGVGYQLQRLEQTRLAA